MFDGMKNSYHFDGYVGESTYFWLVLRQSGTSRLLLKWSEVKQVAERLCGK